MSLVGLLEIIGLLVLIDADCLARRADVRKCDGDFGETVQRSFAMRQQNPPLFSSCPSLPRAMMANAARGS